MSVHVYVYVLPIFYWGKLRILALQKVISRLIGKKNNTYCCFFLLSYSNLCNSFLNLEKQNENYCLKPIIGEALKARTIEVVADTT